MGYHSFEELEVWKQGCRITVKIFELFADCNNYGLKDQVTRSAVSIPSNIAEGAERGSTPDFIRFLHIDKGSAAELRTQIYIASQIGILQKEVQTELIKELKILSSKIQALIASLMK